MLGSEVGVQAILFILGQVTGLLELLRVLDRFLVIGGAVDSVVCWGWDVGHVTSPLRKEAGLYPLAKRVTACTV